MKRYRKILYSLPLIALSAASCGGGADEPEILPVTPQFSQSSVTVEEGETVEVTVTKGVPAYTAASSSTSVATVTVSGSRITVTGVSAGTAAIQVKGSDNGSASFTVTVNADPYKAFKADATLRFEGAGQATVKNTEGKHVFYADKGVILSSAKNKLGYASRDGKTFYFIEWEGDGSAGAKTNASLRTLSGVIALQSLQVIKSEGGILWITYKEKSDSAEGRVVQKW